MDLKPNETRTISTEPNQLVLSLFGTYFEILSLYIPFKCETRRKQVYMVIKLGIIDIGLGNIIIGLMASEIKTSQIHNLQHNKEVNIPVMHN